MNSEFIMHDNIIIINDNSITDTKSAIMIISLK